MKTLEILQTYLDEVAQMVMAGDFDSYAARVCMPFCLFTESTTLIVNDLASLRAGFDDFQQTLKTQRITQMIRLADSSIALSESLVSGRYVTHLLSSAHRAVSPFRSQIILRRETQVWRAASITNSLYNQRWPILVPNAADDPERG